MTTNVTTTALSTNASASVSDQALYEGMMDGAVNPFIVMIGVMNLMRAPTLELLSETAATTSQAADASTTAQNYSNEVNSAFITLQEENDPDKTEAIPADVAEYLDETQPTIDGVCGPNSNGVWVVTAANGCEYTSAENIQLNTGQMSALKGYFDNTVSENTNVTTQCQMVMQLVMQNLSQIISNTTQLMSKLAQTISQIESNMK